MKKILGPHAKWLVVTYDIAASSITPHLPFALWVGGAQGTYFGRRATSQVGLELDVGYFWNQGLNDDRLRKALGRAVPRIPFAGLGLAGLRQLVGPIGASDLGLFKSACQQNELMLENSRVEGVFKAHLYPFSAFGVAVLI